VNNNQPAYHILAHDLLCRQIYRSQIQCRRRL